MCWIYDIHPTKSDIHKSNRARMQAPAQHLGRRLAQSGHISLTYISDSKYAILPAVVIPML